MSQADLQQVPGPSQHAQGPTLSEPSFAVPLASSSVGRVSGKPWKLQKSAAVRSNLPLGVKTKWEVRMEKTKKAHAIKKLQTELREEKMAEVSRRKEITLERKKAAEERRRLEEEKANVRAASLHTLPPVDDTTFRWARGKLPDYAARLAGRKRSTTDTTDIADTVCSLSSSLLQCVLYRL
ncbi:hypothetical protein BKA93DRAFT_182053 [Sparassis latifolia]